MKKIEQELQMAGVSNSGEIAEVIWQSILDMASPVYRYVDEDGVVWFGKDPDEMVDSFGCDMDELEGGYFLPVQRD